MSDGTARLRQFADDDETQAEIIRYLVALGTDNAGGDLSSAQAASLDATAAGWRQIADAADGQVDDPEQH